MTRRTRLVARALLRGWALRVCIAGLASAIIAILLGTLTAATAASSPPVATGYSYDYPSTTTPSGARDTNLERGQPRALDPRTIYDVVDRGSHGASDCLDATFSGRTSTFSAPAEFAWAAAAMATATVRGGVEAVSGVVRLVARDGVATNSAGLGDDFARALDDIDNGVTNPNVRNPKPFANDGRGGTTRLPSADGAGNPVSYTEHTVNARPPGGALDGKRIMVGTDGSVWATSDPFTTWVRVR